MADIELVIKMSEEEYKNICLMSKDGIGMALYDWIANGTPLPKGHGRLIDADAFNDELNNCDYDTYNDYSNTFDWIEEASTIIEADTESEGKE